MSRLALPRRPARETISQAALVSSRGQHDLPDHASRWAALPRQHPDDSWDDSSDEEHQGAVGAGARGSKPAVQKPPLQQPQRAAGSLPHPATAEPASMGGVSQPISELYDIPSGGAEDEDGGGTDRSPCSSDDDAAGCTAAAVMPAPAPAPCAAEASAPSGGAAGRPPSIWKSQSSRGGAAALLKAPLNAASPPGMPDGGTIAAHPPVLQQQPQQPQHQREQQHQQRCRVCAADLSHLLLSEQVSHVHACMAGRGKPPRQAPQQRKVQRLQKREAAVLAPPPQQQQQQQHPDPAAPAVAVADATDPATAAAAAAAALRQQPIGDWLKASERLARISAAAAPSSLEPAPLH